MQKYHLPLIAATLAFVCSGSEAATPGFFAGVQVGAGKINTKDYKKVVDINYQNARAEEGSNVRAAYNNANEGGFSGRLFGGYNFNDYFGVEIGYSEYAKNSYDSLVSSRETSSFVGYQDRIVNSSFKTSAFDLLGKAYLPLKNITPALAPVNLYAKLGMAYVIQKVNVGSHLLNRYDSGSSVVEDPDFRNMTNRKWQPTYGVGAAYALTNKVALDASWTRIQGSGGSIGTGNFNGFTAETNLFALGVVYHFG